MLNISVSSYNAESPMKSNQDVPMSQFHAKPVVPDTEIKNSPDSFEPANFRLLYTYILGNNNQRESVIDELMEKLQPNDAEILHAELRQLRACLALLKQAMQKEV